MRQNIRKAKQHETTIRTMQNNNKNSAKQDEKQLEPACQDWAISAPPPSPSPHPPPGVKCVEISSEFGNYDSHLLSDNNTSLEVCVFSDFKPTSSQSGDPGAQEPR